MDHIEIISLVPKFMKFYIEAQKVNTPEERFSLWKNLYDFAALPPVPERDKLAKDLLDQAWDLYSKYIQEIEQWKPDKNHIEGILNQVKERMGYKGDVEMAVIYFVGGFENNPFVASYNGKPAVCLPMENNLPDIYLAHELTHIVHAYTAELSQGWERSIGSTIIQEGLACRMSQVIIPGFPEENYVEFHQGWLQDCQGFQKSIISGILPHIHQSASDIVEKFTIGNGTTGHEREAYYVGWELIDYLKKSGLNFIDIASIKENEIPSFIKPYLEAMIKD